MKAWISKLWRSGLPFVWLTGGAVALALLMVAGLILLILVNGLGVFWPRDVVRLTLRDGTVVVGEISGREKTPEGRSRIQIKQGNRDLYDNVDFRWVDEDQIAQREQPPEATVLERRNDWGNLYGTPVAYLHGSEPLADGPEAAWQAYVTRAPETEKLAAEATRVEKGDLAPLQQRQTRLQFRLKRIALDRENAGGDPSKEPAWAAEERQVQTEILQLEQEVKERSVALSELRRQMQDQMVLTVSSGARTRVRVSDIVRAWRPNQMGFWQKIGHYGGKLWEFLSGDPRNKNTEGGIYPAIFGTVLMVLIMTIPVTLLGVLAAVFLREYAKQGPLVSLVRVAVNNLAGVPSIVFGVFGLGFLIYGVGGLVDQCFYPEYAANHTPVFKTPGILWASLTLALLTVPVVIVATEEGLAAIPNRMREGALALGATKFETTFKVVLPAVAPSILTGLILALARAAGEVAPLMLTGAFSEVRNLPVDASWPFLHLDQKFMHLGYHIFHVSFNSPNVDASRPMIFAATLLLIVIVLVLNLAAILLRNHLRRKYTVSAV